MTAQQEIEFCKILVVNCFHSVFSKNCNEFHGYKKVYVLFVSMLKRIASFQFLISISMLDWFVYFITCVFLHYFTYVYYLFAKIQQTLSMHLILLDKSFLKIVFGFEMHCSGFWKYLLYFVAWNNLFGAFWLNNWVTIWLIFRSIDWLKQFFYQSNVMKVNPVDQPKRVYYIPNLQFAFVSLFLIRFSPQ